MNVKYSVLEQPEVNIYGASHSPIGVIIQRLFSTAQKLLRMPADEDSLVEDDASSRSSLGSSSNFSPDSSSSKASEFPRPVGKEYILRMFVQRPVPWSRPSPQRMYCVVMKDDFRLAGGFTIDTTFQ